jgi:4-hydroxy-4-methyl-2-oxoglutarate aldolase
MVGYAATYQVRSADPPVLGNSIAERNDWWKHITSMPAPRVVVFQDIDEVPGTGAFLGKVHVNVLKALSCVGAVTNGAARELPGIEASGFRVFAGRIAISRSYVHIVRFGGPVEVGGLKIHPGDLIHGDRRGIITVPPDLAAELPAVAERITEEERQVIELSETPGVCFEELGRALRELLDHHHGGTSQRNG